MPAPPIAIFPSPHCAQKAFEKEQRGGGNDKRERKTNDVVEVVVQQIVYRKIIESKGDPYISSVVDPEPENHPFFSGRGRTCQNES